MKHIQLYEGFLSNIFKKKKKEGRTFIEFIKFKNKNILHSINVINKKLFCDNAYLTDLKGIEKYTHLLELDCSWNKLENLKGVEKLINLKSLTCRDNELKNLDEIKNLSNLEYVSSYGNPFEEPLPIEIVNKFGEDYIYGGKDSNDIKIEVLYIRFGKYEFQKKFLTEHPERVQDLNPFGFHERIKQEFPALIRGSEWGFFDLEGGFV